MPDLDDTRELLASLIRGDALSADDLAAIDPQAFCESARHHCVIPLVVERACADGRLPVAFLDPLRHESRRHAAADLETEREIRLVVAGMAAAGVEAVLLKGAHLAYSVYPRPDLRPRVDSDLLVAPGARDHADAVLVELGYASPRHVSGDLVTYQAQYVKRRSGIPVHVVDLHWRIANPQVFAGVLPFDDVHAASAPLARLHPAARGPSTAHALLLACVHRVAHHFHSDRLIWLYDIHLLASGATNDDWRAFVEMALARHVAKVCEASLDDTIRVFRTVVPGSALARLASRSSPVEVETAAYLTRGRRPIQNFWADVRALPGAARLRLIGQHLFPGPRYMREVYAPSSRAPLSVLYARRILRGTWRWLQRPW